MYNCTENILKNKNYYREFEYTFSKKDVNPIN